MSQDPACKGTNTAEALLASGGHLANVFVYVKDGLGSRTFDVPKQPVTLDQSGCKYHPHMLGVMIGQEVKIVNSDPTTHNIHPQDRKSTRLNSSHGYISYAVFCLKKKSGAESGIAISQPGYSGGCSVSRVRCTSAGDLARPTQQGRRCAINITHPPLSHSDQYFTL